MGFSLSDPAMTTVTGTAAGAGYEIKLSTYYIVNEGMTYTNGDIRWRDLYSYLFGNLTNNIVISENTLRSVMDGSPKPVHRICLGVSPHHGLYALMSEVKNLTMNPTDDEASFTDLMNTVRTSIRDLFQDGIVWTGYDPPNQIEYIADPHVGSHYYIPINPMRDTVRRTLAYANYIADGNTAMDAEAGNPVYSWYSTYWQGSWFVQGKLRSIWTWPRRLQGQLSKGDIPNCSNAEIGVTTTFFTATWKGIETFRKGEHSVAWIPGEMYHWPCSCLYRFYSAASSVDNVSTCRSRNLPVGFLFPLILTSPISAMGFTGEINIAALSNFSVAQSYLSVYGRPYEDDSDGSGVWHQMA